MNANEKLTARINTLCARIQASAEDRAYRAARAEVGAHATCPVIVVEGNAAPKMTGESYYWTTPSGKTRVEHPNAYGWPTLYHNSTLAVEVGVGWLLEREPGFRAAWESRRAQTTAKQIAIALEPQGVAS